jgi:hypothetical protein
LLPLTYCRHDHLGAIVHGPLAPGARSIDHEGIDAPSPSYSRMRSVQGGNVGWGGPVIPPKTTLGIGLKQYTAPAMA